MSIIAREHKLPNTEQILYPKKKASITRLIIGDLVLLSLQLQDVLSKSVSRSDTLRRRRQCQLKPTAKS